MWRARPRPTSLLLGFLLASCNGEPVPSPDAILRLGSREVRHPEFETYLERNIGDPGSALPSEVLSELFDQFLDEVLLAELAADRGLSPPGTDSRTAVGLLVADAAARKATPTEVASYYREHRGQFVRPERVRLSQILVDDHAAAERVRREIDSGADFAEVAKRESREPRAAFGGDQGELARGDLPPVFAEKIFALAPGEVSDIVPADYGFHLFQVVERLPAQELTLAEAEAEIRAQLARDNAEGRLGELVREARARYNPQVYVRNLPFNYVGRYSSPTG
jgi:hypothetical protein